MTKSHGSYVCIIYMAHKYIFDASMLWKEMVDILLLIFLQQLDLNNDDLKLGT